jgi:hypothetical protein
MTLPTLPTLPAAKNGKTHPHIWGVPGGKNSEKNEEQSENKTHGGGAISRKMNE